MARFSTTLSVLWALPPWPLTSKKPHVCTTSQFALAASGVATISTDEGTPAPTWPKSQVTTTKVLTMPVVHVAEPAAVGPIAVPLGKLVVDTRWVVDDLLFVKLVLKLTGWPAFPTFGASFAVTVTSALRAPATAAMPAAPTTVTTSASAIARKLILPLILLLPIKGPQYHVKTCGYVSFRLAILAQSSRNLKARSGRRRPGGKPKRKEPRRGGALSTYFFICLTSSCPCPCPCPCPCLCPCPSACRACPSPCTCR